MDKRLKTLAAWRRQQWSQQLLRQFARAEIFIVGGAVRDALLNRPTKDVDFVVRHVPAPALEKFLARRGKVKLVGKRFGVFKFIPTGREKIELDIALPRTEHVLAGTGAYRDFKISSQATLPIKDDLSRRDFTINALAWDIATGTLIDPFGGVNDLKRKIIRTVGTPALRFAEDYSRLLRAIRFANQLEFTIEPKTLAAVKSLMPKINHVRRGERVVPYEVIAKELHKTLVAAPARALQLLDASGTVKALMPELLTMKKCPQPTAWHSEGDVWQHTALALNIITDRVFAKEFDQAGPSVDLVWAVLFHDSGKPATLTKTDHIRFNGHDIKSAKIFRLVAERLKIASAGVNIDDIEQVIARHMILTDATIKNIKATTLEKYFFSTLFPGQLLRQLLFVDVSASRNSKGKSDFTNYRLLKQKLRTIAGTKRQGLPAPLLTGHDVMKTFKISAGPRIGEILALIREAQLSGKIKTKAAALAYAKKQSSPPRLN